MSVSDDLKYKPLTQIVERCKELETTREIPAITLIGSEVIAKHELKNFSLQKIASLNIKQVLNSRLVTKYPNSYQLENIFYQYVKVCGEIIRITVCINTVSLKILDGPCQISVILADRDIDNNEIAMLIAESDKNQLSYQKVNSIINSGNPEFISLDKKEEESLLNTVSNTFMKKIYFQTKVRCPNGIEWGYEVNPCIVEAVGRVADMKKRVVFAWSVKKKTTLNEFVTSCRNYINNSFIKTDLNNIFL